MMDHGKFMLKKLFPFLTFIIILYLMNRKNDKRLNKKITNYFFIIIYKLNSFIFMVFKISYNALWISIYFYTNFFDNFYFF